MTSPDPLPSTDEVRAVLEAATPGPWYAEGNDVYSERLPSATSHDIATQVWNVPDANLIAAAPSIAAAYLALAAQREKVLELLDDPGGPDSWSHTFDGRQSLFADDIRAALTDPKGTTDD